MTPPPSSFSRPVRLRAAAFLLLVAGLALAARIDQNARLAQAAAADQDILAAAPLAPGDSKRYGYQVGQLSGQTGVLFDRASQAASGLFHGRPLALLIALASFAAAGALLLAADRLPHPPE